MPIDPILELRLIVVVQWHEIRDTRIRDDVGLLHLCVQDLDGGVICRECIQDTLEVVGDNGHWERAPVLVEK